MSLLYFISPVQIKNSRNIYKRGGTRVKEIVEKMIDEVEAFENHDSYWQDLKKDTLKELERKPTSDNQYLWICIKLIAEYMQEYVR